MEITDEKEVEKFWRKATLKELKDVVTITLGRIRTKRELGFFLRDYSESILRRLK